MSTPALNVRCGDKLAAVITLARAISSIRRPMSSSEIGSAYIACSRRAGAGTAPTMAG
jgi:hypothetical protein